MMICIKKETSNRNLDMTNFQQKPRSKVFNNVKIPDQSLIFPPEKHFFKRDALDGCHRSLLNIIVMFE